jgi:hypothetical protein
MSYIYVLRNKFTDDMLYCLLFRTVFCTSNSKFKPPANLIRLYVDLLIFTYTYPPFPLHSQSLIYVLWNTLQMMLNSKDLSFVGYTYKNFDAVKAIKISGLSPYDIDTPSRSCVCLILQTIISGSLVIPHFRWITSVYMLGVHSM